MPGFSVETVSEVKDEGSFWEDDVAVAELQLLAHGVVFLSSPFLPSEEADAEILVFARHGGVERSPLLVALGLRVS